MGIKEFLTTPINFGSSEKYHWNEPILYRIRLRGDLWLRLIIVASMWGAGTGILLMLFSINNNPPGPGTAVFLGAAFALGPAMGTLFWRRRLTSGRIFLRPADLQRTSTSWGLPLMQSNLWRWPLREISRCVLVPAESLGVPFSVLIVESDDSEELIGLPATADRRRIGEILKLSGVTLAKGHQLSSEWTTGLSRSTGLLVSALGMLPLLVGATVYWFAVHPADGRRDFMAEQRQSFQQDHPPKGNLPLPPGLPGIGVSPAGPGASIATPDAASGSGRLPDAASGLPSFGGAPPGVIPGLNRAGAPPNPATIGRPSELVGGKGGSPFLKWDSKHRAIRGIGYRLGSWAGRNRVALLSPFFDSTNEGRPETVFADKGYAIGAIRVDSDDLVNAIQIVFMKDNGNGTLDPSDSYESDWIGSPSGNAPKLLSGNGDYVIGIHGRGAAVLDAVGIVLRP